MAARVVDNEAIAIAIVTKAGPGFRDVIVSAAKQVAKFVRQCKPLDSDPQLDGQQHLFEFFSYEILFCFVEKTMRFKSLK